jgi:hypothetical protein
MTGPETAIAERLDELAQRFQLFGELECAGYSPLYERLCKVIVGDRDVLELAGRATSRPIPNLFFGALHYLLLSGVDGQLASYYPSVSSSPLDPDEEGLGSAFHDFCAKHAGEITTLLRSRRVQTNEVRRSVFLMLALASVARAEPSRPLALVEVGAAAGLNLLYDHYTYAFGDRVVAALTGARALRLECEPRGPIDVPVPDSMPVVADRVGIDLNPVDLSEPEDRSWLRALVWPEHRQRAERLERAIEIAAADPPEVMAGDALDLLPHAIRAMPKDATVCIYHSATLNQMRSETRARFAVRMQELARERELAWISVEGSGIVHAAPRQPSAGSGIPTFLVVGLVTYDKRAWKEGVLALGDAHGRWVEWLEKPRSKR